MHQLNNQRDEGCGEGRVK